MGGSCDKQPNNSVSRKRLEQVAQAALWELKVARSVLECGRKVKLLEVTGNSGSQS